jgi:formylglycine-generating enzyme required for sulfatase activity
MSNAEANDTQAAASGDDHLLKLQTELEALDLAGVIQRLHQRTGLAVTTLAAVANDDASKWTRLAKGTETRPLTVEQIEHFVQVLPEEPKLLSKIETKELAVWRRALVVAAQSHQSVQNLRSKREADSQPLLAKAWSKLEQMFRAQLYQFYDEEQGALGALLPFLTDLVKRWEWLQVPAGFEVREVNEDECILVRGRVIGTADFGPDAEVEKLKGVGRYRLRRKGSTPSPRIQSAPPEPAPTQPDRRPARRTASYIEPELIRIPASYFWMGSDESDTDAKDRSWEKPRHRVYVSEFWIARYPVTNEEYRLFLRANPLHKEPSGWQGRNYPAGKANHPVVYVTWQDAADYCRWLSGVTVTHYALPTEAQWEKAARGIESRKYPWGNEWDARRCNASEGEKRGTTPVGAYSPAGDSPYGVADMVGNVWEWCADWWSADEYKRRAGREVRDPIGPQKGDYHALRGGAWDSTRRFARCAARGRYEPDARDDFIGFRVVAASPVSR